MQQLANVRGVIVERTMHQRNRQNSRELSHLSRRALLLATGQIIRRPRDKQLIRTRPYAVNFTYRNHVLLGESESLVGSIILVFILLLDLFIACEGLYDQSWVLDGHVLKEKREKVSMWRKNDANACRLGNTTFE